MKLIKVETRGFKSFADKTILNFDGGVVGIVGPNGSGKSNINDAIKWVLGEQSIKNLRGDSSDDVIFSGSKTASAASEAEVSLTFDNSNGAISLPGNTVTITRIIKRGEGSNKYYINGNDARLKDIKEIAMESGIGKSSLAIISQGTISDIAEATPEQRRGIFEEAAGISKYKNRKKEALRKLESTSEALDKLNAIIKELERQLNPLKRQAEKARRYMLVKGKLKSIEVSVIVKDIDFFEKKLSELNDKLEHVIEAKDSLSQNINGLEMQIEEKTSYKLKIENEVVGLSNKLQEINEKLNQIEIDNSRISERRRMIIDGEVKSSSKAKLDAMTDELKRLSDNVAKYQIWEDKSLSDITDKRLVVSKIQTDLSRLNYQLDDRKRRLTKWTTKLAILNDHQNNKFNLFKGVKHIVENKDLFPGYKGLISELITVDVKYEKAIEAILSSALQHIVVDIPETAVKAVNFLRSNKGGRATFIPMSSIKPKGFVSEHEMIMASLEGFIDRASDLVQTEPDHKILAKFLLGNIIVVSDIKCAKNIASTLNNRYMVVTLEGDIIRVGGVISGGQAQRSSDLLGFKEKIDKLTKAIPLLGNEITLDSKKTSELSISISEEQAIIAELNIEIAKIREKRELTESQLINLKSNYETQTNQKFIYKAKTDFLSEDNFNHEKNSVSTLLKAKRESIISINNDLSQFTIQKTEFERTLRDILESSSKQMTEKAQAEFVLSSSKKRLAEEYGMTTDAAKDNVSEVGDIDTARDMITELRSEIKEIGHVNLDSIEMFDEVNERYTKLKNSEEELFLAQQTIVSAIDEMDQIIISKLDQTVKGTNEEFKNVFIKMFGGGHAEINYTDPSNLLETGIDVIAQPPGKTVKNLKLFSGGEKSMIAISLLFAILKAKPLPLCILDEVEAALDEANVIRFAEYLQQLKHQTQFMVITHRFGTMSRVDHLFGASMQNRGVTSFFSVKLEDARKYID